MPNNLPMEKKVQILNALVEENSICSIVRMFDVHKGAVLRLLREAGNQSWGGVGSGVRQSTISLRAVR